MNSFAMSALVDAAELLSRYINDFDVPGFRMAIEAEVYHNASEIDGYGDNAVWHARNIFAGSSLLNAFDSGLQACRKELENWKVEIEADIDTNFGATVNLIGF